MQPCPLRADKFRESSGFVKALGSRPGILMLKKKKLHVLFCPGNCRTVGRYNNPGQNTRSGPAFPSISPHRISHHHGRANDWPCHPQISHDHEDGNLPFWPVRCPSRRCCSATEHRSTSIWPALAENLKYSGHGFLSQMNLIFSRQSQDQRPPHGSDLPSTLGGNPEFLIHHSSKGDRTKTRGCFSQLDRTAAGLRANATSNRNASRFGTQIRLEALSRVLHCMHDLHHLFACMQKTASTPWPLRLSTWAPRHRHLVPLSSPGLSPVLATGRVICEAATINDHGWKPVQVRD